MTRRQVTTGYVSAILDLPENTDATAGHAVSPALPGGWRLAPPGPDGRQPTVEITIGPAGITADADTVRLRLPRAAAVSGTLAYVSYTALERARQQQGMVTLHGSALHAPGGQAVLLLGAKGAGKTSAALALARRGWVHAGDDLVVLAETAGGTLAVWPGKRTAAIRDPRSPLTPKPGLSLQPFAAGPARLGWIVRIAVHPGIPAAALTPAVPLSANEGLRLHENAARYISGLPTPLTGVSPVPYGPVWPLDTPALARWRSHLITVLASCRFDYLHAPSADAAADLLITGAGRG